MRRAYTKCIVENQQLTQAQVLYSCIDCVYAICLNSGFCIILNQMHYYYYVSLNHPLCAAGAEMWGVTANFKEMTANVYEMHNITYKAYIV